MSGKADRVRVLEGVGIIAASYSAGVIFSLSNVALPAAQVAPTRLAVKQWTIVFWKGLFSGPPGSIIATLAFGWLAYTQPKLRQLYTAAALLPASIFVYTHVAMVSTNDELLRREKESEKLPEGEAATEVGMPTGQQSAELIAKWRSLNYLRSLMPLAGAIVGAWAALAYS